MSPQSPIFPNAVASKISRSTPGKQLLQNPLCTGDFGCFSWVSWYLVWSCRQELAFLHSWLHIQCYLSRWKPWRTFLVVLQNWQLGNNHKATQMLDEWECTKSVPFLHVFTCKCITLKKGLHTRMPSPSDCRSSSYGPRCRFSHGSGEFSSLPRRSSIPRADVEQIDLLKLP